MHLNEKKIRKIWTFFDIENWMSKFHDFWCHCAILALQILKNSFATFDFFCKNEACVKCGTHKRHNSHLVTGRCKLHKTKSVRNHGEKFCNYHKSSQFVQSFFEVADRILILKSHKILVRDVSHKNMSGNPVANANS